MRGDKWRLTLADLAESQWGLFTSAQAGELGVAPQQLKRLADSELIVRLRQGVYRLAGTPEAAEEPIRAEWLALEPKRLVSERLADPMPIGVVSHRSAARMQNLGDHDADVHEFIVPRRRGTRSREVRFHLRSIDRADWWLVSGLPVTRPLPTVVDLAASRLDGGHLATIVRDAVLTGDTTIPELATALRPYAHYYGVPLGAGADLVSRFIAQAGVPESTVALARNFGMVDAQAKSRLEQVLGELLTNDRFVERLVAEHRARRPGDPDGSRRGTSSEGETATRGTDETGRS